MQFPDTGRSMGVRGLGAETRGRVHVGPHRTSPGMWRRELEDPVSSAGEGHLDTVSTRWHLELWLVDSVDMGGAGPGRHGTVWHLQGRRGWGGAAKRCPLARMHTASRGAQRQTTGLVQVPDLQGGERARLGWKLIRTSRERNQDRHSLSNWEKCFLGLGCVLRAKTARMLKLPRTAGSSSKRGLCGAGPRVSKTNVTLSESCLRPAPTSVCAHSRHFQLERATTPLLSAMDSEVCRRACLVTERQTVCGC